MSSSKTTAWARPSALGRATNKLREVNPRIVYCSISGYGEQGPYRMRPGQDLVIQAYSGSMWSVGSKHDLPMPGALWAADAMAAYQAGIGILAALWARQRTGEGQKVEVNMLGVTMDAQTQELTTHLNLGILPERSEESSAHAWIPAPYGVYKTADGFIVLAMAPTHILGEALDSDRLREFTDWSDVSRTGTRFMPLLALFCLQRPAQNGSTYSTSTTSGPGLSTTTKILPTTRI